MPSQRAARRFAEPRSSVEVTGEHSQFRLDLERIRFSPYFSRLSAVTQVIAQPGAGPLIHNRLTHSIKVTAVARAIAVGMHDPASPAHELALEHGCDAVVVQAAASAHDLGHPRSATSASACSTGWPGRASDSPTGSRATRRPTASSPRSTCARRRRRA